MKNPRSNKNQKPIFVQTIIASSILSLSMMNHAAAWTINHGAEHDSDTTTVEKGETAAKIDAYQSDAPNIVAGEMNRGGNPARLVWYGKSSDADGHTAQNKANNQGYIWGRVIAQGTDSETKDEKNSSIQVEAQGNAIDAMGWTAPTNYHDVIMNIQKIINDGVAIGEADLKGGLGSVHGRVETFGSANGISILGATDWGNSTIDGTSGATGKSSSTSVGTMTTTTRKPNDFRKPGSQGTGYDSDKQLTSEINGKTVQVLVGNLNQNSQNVIENNGLLRGELKAVANQEITNPVTDEDYPQFFGTKSGASGNGISVASLVSSVNKQSDSSEKYNYAMINGLIANKGTVEGLATVKGGSNTTWTQTSSVATGNGISVFAQTRSPANSKTAAFMSGLNNDGKIIG